MATQKATPKEKKKMLACAGVFTSFVMKVTSQIKSPTDFIAINFCDHDPVITTLILMSTKRFLSF